MSVIEKIEEQQKKAPVGSVAWCVAEDLKAICIADPECAAIVAEDLESKSMSIFECAKKNQENADRIHKQSKGSCIRIPQSEEERIIREFYSLPGAAEASEPDPVPTAPEAEEEDVFDFSDYL